MARFSSLTLTHFRNHSSLQCEDLSAPFVILAGPNGIGKTNVLEALSYFAPGRGLRSADLAACQHMGTDARLHPWGVFATLDQHGLSHTVATGFDAESNKRLVNINGARVKSQADLAHYVTLHWLTPKEDRIFLDGASDRRRLLDRMVYGFDPAHAGRVTRYEKVTADRARILREQEAPDASWLSALEDQMAQTSVSIAAARRTLIARLNAVIAQNADPDFPQPDLALSGFAEEALAQDRALVVEENLRQALYDARARDARMGGAMVGAHRADLHAQNPHKEMPAALCSTGEQKALLVGLMLAYARLLAQEAGRPPILLLDEVAAHLDDQRRARLFSHLYALSGQVFLTGTDAALFQDVPHAVHVLLATAERTAA